MISDHQDAVMTDAATAEAVATTTEVVEVMEADPAILEVTDTVEIAINEVVVDTVTETTGSATTMATGEVASIAMPLALATALAMALAMVLAMVLVTLARATLARATLVLAILVLAILAPEMTDTPAVLQTVRTTVEEVVVAGMTEEDQPMAVAMLLHHASPMQAAEAEASTTAVMTGTHVDEDLH